MKRYYTRVCNFYYGKESKILIGKKKTLPLKGNNNISFDHIEIISILSKEISLLPFKGNASFFLTKILDFVPW